MKFFLPAAFLLALGGWTAPDSTGGAAVVGGAPGDRGSTFCRFDLGGARSPGDGGGVPSALHCTCLEEIMYFVNSDQKYDQAVMWRGEALGPDSGTFAEYYETPDNRAGAVCQLVLHLTDAGAGTGTTLDVIVWEDDAGFPGEVLGIVPHTILSAPPFPAIGTRQLEVYEIQQIGVQGGFWVGIRGNWDSEECTFLLPIDTVDDNPEGPARLRRTATYVGEGAAELEPGWHLLEEVLGVPAASGILAVVGWCPVPVVETSWGQVKRLYEEGR